MTFPLAGHDDRCVLHLQRHYDHATDSRIIELRFECHEECPVREEEMHCETTTDDRTVSA